MSTHSICWVRVFCSFKCIGIYTAGVVIYCLRGIYDVVETPLKPIKPQGAYLQGSLHFYFRSLSEGCGNYRAYFCINDPELVDSLSKCLMKLN